MHVGMSQIGPGHRQCTGHRQIVVFLRLRILAIRTGDRLADLRAPNRVRKSVNTLTDPGGSAVADAASHEFVEEGKLLVAESGGHRTGHGP